MDSIYICCIEKLKVIQITAATVVGISATQRGQIDTKEQP